MSTCIFDCQQFQNEYKTRRFYIWLATVAAMAFFFAFGAILYMGHEPPESFKQGVKLLKTNKFIKSKIGASNSHSWKESELPSENDNPASFKVSIHGSDATIHLSSIVRKEDSGQWKLMEIRQDSLTIRARE